jgi:nucleotide-binding universal stress UspA family protein
MLTGALGCKALAAVIAGRWFGYSPNQILLMWSLAMPKVAATLATAFIGFQAGLIDNTVLNSVLAVMVVTATLGPTLTTRSVVALMEPNERSKYGTTGLDEDQEVPGEVVRRPLKVLVPVANPDTELSLLKLACRLSQGDGDHNGQLLPLALVSPSLEEARGGLNRALSAARTRLNQAATNGEGLTATTRCLLRVDDDIAAGMSRSALEEGADLLLIGAGRPDPLRKWLLGDLVDGVCRTAHCPVVVAKLGRLELNNLNQILVPIKDLSASAREQFELALRLLSTAPDPKSTTISLLHIHDPRFNRHERSWMEHQLISWCPRNIASHQIQIKLLQGPGIDAKIHLFSKKQDLVILRSQRRRVAGLPIPASDRTSNLVHQLACPALMISDPLH